MGRSNVKSTVMRFTRVKSYFLPPMIPSSPLLYPYEYYIFRLPRYTHTHNFSYLHPRSRANDITNLLWYYYNIERNTFDEKPFFSIFSDFCFSTFYTMFACLCTKRWTRNYVVEMKTNSVDERVRILL
jgi:hypothetical protein